MCGNVLKDRSRNSFKMELFVTIGNGRVYNHWIHVAVVTQLFLQTKLKLDKNGHALTVAKVMSFYLISYSNEHLEECVVLLALLCTAVHLGVL